MSSIIEIRGLSKRYTIKKNKGDYLSFREQLVDSFRRINPNKYFWALKDIDLDINVGDCVGIVGNNGAGKSTLLKILARVTPPTSGYIKLKGRVASLLEVGTGFHQELSGRENIYLNGSILGLSKEEINRKFDEIVDFSGVEQFLDTPLKHYSSGMQLRLAFSVAAHLEPEILLIDEVLAVGDIGFQQKCIGKMNEVSQDGRTILFVSHNMGVINRLCSKGILLSESRMIYTGDIKDTIDKFYNTQLRSPKIKEYSDRQGDGRIRIKQIELLDQNKQLKQHNTFNSGEPIYFHISYEVKDYSSKVVKDFHIGISFFNQMGQFMTVLNNKMANFNLTNIPASGTVECFLDRLPLIDGSYYANVRLEIDSLLSDRIERAFQIQVNEGDFYRSGFTNSQKRNGVYIKQSWSIQSPYNN